MIYLFHVSDYGNTKKIFKSCRPTALIGKEDDIQNEVGSINGGLSRAWWKTIGRGWCVQFWGKRSPLVRQS